MGTTKFVTGMRDVFFAELRQIFRRDKNCVLITADNGAPTLDQFAKEFPKQYYNVGIAEQQMMGMACGMAFEGKKVYTYAIAPFVTIRCYDQNKLDMCAMNLPIVNLGVGAGYAYDIMGPSHHTVEDITVMRVLPNLKIYGPADGVTARALADIAYKDKSPQYIRFDRSGIPNLYEERKVDFEEGLVQVNGCQNPDITLVATGVMVHNALKVAQNLEERDFRVGVIDLFRLKPINAKLLVRLLKRSRSVVTLEEHLLAGGMGSALLEVLSDEGLRMPTLRIGQEDRFVFDYGGREAIWEKYGLDVSSVTEKVSNWLELQMKNQVLMTQPS